MLRRSPEAAEWLWLNAREKLGGWSGSVEAVTSAAAAKWPVVTPAALRRAKPIGKRKTVRVR